MKKVILIADDSSTMRKFVSFSLKMKNFDVVAAEDGMDALEKLSQTRIDLGRSEQRQGASPRSAPRTPG